MKLKLRSPLNISSVNLVQNRMYLLYPLTPIVTMKKDVHMPTQVYIGKNAKPLAKQKRYSPVRKAKVNPVGAINVIG